MKNKILPRSKYLFFFLIITFTFVSPKAIANEKYFFSYKRLLLNQDFTDRMLPKSRIKGEINKFVDSYNEGIYAISNGDFREAGGDLLKAREAWPEYFYTDFLLGLVYEEQGKHKLAARYYKSYLNKLKRYSEGEYRISGALIVNLSRDDIEEYGEAYYLVREHLEGYNINLNRVVPMVRIPGFVSTGMLLLFIIGAYVLVNRWVLPQIKIWKRIKSPPEGFWVCRHCYTDNTELNTECTKCGRRKE
ncbi:MAG: tetratricopeptide repeat protein [Candidatus Omnitrophica bacterium]|nr:tetratricopeptide repeat protein [Candidatus Omnitrophota bacterium]